MNELRKTKALLLAIIDARDRYDIMKLNHITGLGDRGKYVQLWISLNDRSNNIIITAAIAENTAIIVYSNNNERKNRSVSIRNMLKKYGIPEYADIILIDRGDGGIKLKITSCIIISNTLERLGHISDQMCIDIFDLVMTNLTIHIAEDTTKVFFSD